MIKTIFFDVDGTLLSHYSNKVPASTKEALEKARAKGVQCLVATGRHLPELDKLPVRDLLFDGYITLNGQLCYDGQRNLVFGNPITGTEKDALIQLFESKTIPMLLVDQGRMYANFINQRLLQAHASISAPEPPVGRYNGVPIYQAVAYVTPDERAMLQALLPDCQVTWWTEMGVDIVPKDAGKVAGIKRYLQQHGISQIETMAFGDGENDIAMLQFAGIGIAMGNAQSQVMESADYVTTHIDEDGIANAMRHFGII